MNLPKLLSTMQQVIEHKQPEPKKKIAIVEGYSMPGWSDPLSPEGSSKCERRSTQREPRVSEQKIGMREAKWEKARLEAKETRVRVKKGAPSHVSAPLKQNTSSEFPLHSCVISDRGLIELKREQPTHDQAKQSHRFRISRHRRRLPVEQTAEFGRVLELLQQARATPGFQRLVRDAFDKGLNWVEALESVLGRVQHSEELDGASSKQMSFCWNESN